MAARERKRRREGEAKEEVRERDREREEGETSRGEGDWWRGKGVRVLEFAGEGRKGRASPRSLGHLSLVTRSGEPFHR